MSAAGGFLAYKRRALSRAVPLSVHLELTYACNWRCVFCYNPRHHDLTRMSLAEWEPVLDDLRTLGALSVALTGGEPLRHPEFFGIAAAVRARALLLKVYTNGSLIDDETAERLAALDPRGVEMSLHGSTPEVHDAATGRTGSFQALWEGLRRLRARGVALRLKTPLTRLNEHQLDEMIALARDEGAAYTLDPTITPRDDGDRGPLSYAPSADGVARVMSRLRAAGRLPTTEREEGGVNCGLGRLTLAVDPEGNVYPCLQWRRSTLGNVRQRRLIELWDGSAQRQQAAEVSRAANDKLVRLGGAAAQFPFCPALAMEASGDPLALHEDFLRQAEAAEASRQA